jgi:phage virion morphogenesis protein
VAGAGIAIAVDDSQALGALASVAARLEHPAPLFDLIGAMLVTSTQMRFERQQDPQGNPWPPSIRALTEGGRTLVDSAHLRNSITHEADDHGVAVGTNVPYAAPNFFGADIYPREAEALVFTIGGRKVFSQHVHLPARQALGLDEDDVREIEAIAGEYVLAPADAGDADAR